MTPRSRLLVATAGLLVCSAGCALEVSEPSTVKRPASHVVLRGALTGTITKTAVCYNGRASDARGYDVNVWDAPVADGTVILGGSTNPDGHASLMFDNDPSGFGFKEWILYD